MTYSILSSFWINIGCSKNRSNISELFSILNHWILQFSIVFECRTSKLLVNIAFRLISITHTTFKWTFILHDAQVRFVVWTLRKLHATVIATITSTGSGTVVSLETYLSLVLGGIFHKLRNLYMISVICKRCFFLSWKRKNRILRAITLALQTVFINS